MTRIILLTRRELASLYVFSEQLHAPGKFHRLVCNNCGEMVPSARAYAYDGTAGKKRIIAHLCPDCEELKNA